MGFRIWLSEGEPEWGADKARGRNHENFTDFCCRNVYSFAQYYAETENELEDCIRFMVDLAMCSKDDIDEMQFYVRSLNGEIEREIKWEDCFRKDNQK